jgi:hypothetical protein
MMQSSDSSNTNQRGVSGEYDLSNLNSLGVDDSLSPDGKSPEGRGPDSFAEEKLSAAFSP